jgi:hypothetical protein
MPTEQAIKSPTIAVLLAELVDRVKTRKEFSDRAFSVYNGDDLSMKMSSQTTPAAGVFYERCSPIEPPNTKTMQASNVKTSFLYYTLTFSILIGVEYSPDGDTDVKPIATDLLDAVRKCLIGFKGVNGKPWRFTGEQPVGSDVRGVIWYGQTWETDVPQVSINK